MITRPFTLRSTSLVLCLVLTSACGPRQPAPEMGESTPTPAGALEGLESFHAEALIQVDGQENGRDYHEEQSVVFESLNGGSSELHKLEMVKNGGESRFSMNGRSGDTQYLKERAEIPCQSVKADSLEYYNPLPDPRVLAPVARDAISAGAELVNGVPTTHYTFDQAALSLPATVQAAGDYWLAREGGYLVKYLLTIQAPKDSIREGFEGTYTWEYNLSQINSLEDLSLPDDCLPVLEEGPVLGDAVNVVRWPHVLEYTTSASVAEAQAFYREELEAAGFSETGEPVQLEDDVILTFQNLSTSAVQHALVDLETQPEGLNITYFLFTARQPDASQATATPELTQQTEGAAILPADVPIYSGAYQTTTIPGAGLAFLVNDPYEVVAEFYRTQLTASGWHLEAEVPGEGSITLMWTKEGKTLSVSSTESDAGTEVMLIIG